MLELTARDGPDNLSATAASFFDASEDCVKILGLEGELLAMNANGICLLEIKDFEAMRGQPWADMWPEDERDTITSAIATALCGQGARFAADCPTAAGTPKSWEVVVWPVLNDAGRPVQLISISRDVTERRRAEEERALLTRELAHRIRNMFAIVDGVVSLSSRAATEAKPFADALRKRLHGLGRAIAYVSPPELIGQGGTTDHTLLGLLRVLLEPYCGGGSADQHLSISGDDAPIGARATTSMALVVNELATNAIKYGALRLDDGHVDLQIAVDHDVVRMNWRESSGSGDVADIRSVDQRGFGSVLLENAVIHQLGGRFARKWTPGGVVVEMSFPKDRIGR